MSLCSEAIPRCGPLFPGGGTWNENFSNLENLSIKLTVYIAEPAKGSWNYIIHTGMIFCREVEFEHCGLKIKTYQAILKML